MVDDPYKILGVPQSADKDTIKKAYRQMAKRYHPDLHPEDVEACEEKMKELNEAYDMLMNPEKHAAQRARQQAQQNAQRQSTGYSSTQQGNYHQQTQQQTYGSRQQGAGGWYSDFGGFGFEDLFGFGFAEAAPQNSRPQYEAGDSPQFRQAVDAINSGRYQEAVNILIYIQSTGRNARWYYLCSLANHGMGNQVQAIDQMQRACQLEPNNQLYHRMLQQYRRAEQTYEQNARGFNMQIVHLDKLCMGLCLSQICCNPFCRCI